MPTWRSGRGSGSAWLPAGEAVAPPGNRRAAEVQRQALRVEHDLHHVRVGELGRRRRSGGPRCSCWRSGLASSSAATASISAGSISGSSPCTLTTMSSSGQAQQLAGLGEAVAAGGVVGARQHGFARHGLRRRRRCARCRPRRPPGSRPTGARAAATRTTIGRPPMSARGLSGRRVEASRAGIRTVKATGASVLHQRRARGQPLQFLVAQRARLVLPAGRGCRRAPGYARRACATSAPAAPGRSPGGPWSRGRRAVQEVWGPCADDSFASSRRSQMPRQNAGSTSSSSGTAQASGPQPPELDRVLLGADQLGAAGGDRVAAEVVVIRQRDRLRERAGPRPAASRKRPRAGRCRQWR